ncbi:transporter [Actinomycetaceae bacterium WB03_NA08]|uniref:Transporter n=1 Tax=Scrofimicrobium canadense TaxID=2652290 RepID=A0A6N7W4H2_9ACTO|nr:TrkA C-terminal domain-containing protein [Scrofimicrobium canadense]MSS83413.1 transporter [Scrofimicrobium canadense]
MIAALAQYPLLTLFLVVALGAAVGAIRVGPVRFGAAGALFVGLVLSAVEPALSGDVTLIQQLGLALFVYTVGVAAGSSFLSGLRANASLLVTAVIVSALAVPLTAFLGWTFGIPAPLSTGLFTGALTAAPALDLASQVTGSPDAAVGYSFGYPIGVIVGIVFVSLTAGRHWAGKRDVPSLAGAGLRAVTVEISEEIDPHDVDAWARGHVRLSYVRRDGRTRVLAPGEPLRSHDEVVVVGEPPAVEEAARVLGAIKKEHLADDRSDVSFERVTISNPVIAGRTIAELGLPHRFAGLITRVRRGDLDLLAREDLPLQLGDHVAVVVPRERLSEVQDYLGDSQDRVAEVDALAFGLGLTLGLLVGLVSFPLPGGESFSLGFAGGPLVVGMLLGALRRTGPLVWVLPTAANLTIRQLGLLFFLAALGLGAGPAVAVVLTSDLGWRSALSSFLIVTISCTVFAIVGKMRGLSAQRTAGGIAGFLGQPAVLQAANAQIRDERIESAYAALFAASIIAKTLLVPLLWTISLSL